MRVIEIAVENLILSLSKDEVFCSLAALRG